MRAPPAPSGLHAGRVEGASWPAHAGIHVSDAVDFLGYAPYIGP